MPEASHSFDGIAARYDESRGGESRGRRFASKLAPHLVPSRIVVDIGVGTGLVARGLREVGFEVVGIDRSAPMLARAAGRIGGRVVRADATRLPLASDSCAQALSVWLLHLVPAAAVLAEVARVLVPGGRYVVVSSVRPPIHTRDDTSRIFDELMRALDPAWVEGRLDSRDALAALAPAAGLEMAAEDAIEQLYADSPAAIVSRIEARAYSRLVDLGAAEWDTHVKPALRALRALPDPDRPREQVGRHDVTVLRKPS